MLLRQPCTLMEEEEDVSVRQINSESLERVQFETVCVVIQAGYPTHLSTQLVFQRTVTEERTIRYV